MTGGLSRKVLDAPLLIAAGAALLLSTIDLPWYASSLGGCCETYGETFYPTWVQVWDSGVEGTASAGISYSSIQLFHTGTLYLVILILLVTGGLLGVSAAFAVRRGRHRVPRRWVSALVVLAAIVALAAPVLVVVAQPAAICSDSVVVSAPFEAPPASASTGGSLPCGWQMAYPDGYGGWAPGSSWSTPGPQSSLMGGENLSGYWHSWAPSIGWYIALAASALILVGAAEYLRVERSHMPVRGIHDNPEAVIGPGPPAEQSREG